MEVKALYSIGSDGEFELAGQQDIQAGCPGEGLEDLEGV